MRKRSIFPRILNNPYAGPKEKVTFDPKHVYDFELEKSKDETVLLKQLELCTGKQTDAEALMWK